MILSFLALSAKLFFALVEGIVIAICCVKYSHFPCINWQLD